MAFLNRFANELQSLSPVRDSYEDKQITGCQPAQDHKGTGFSKARRSDMRVKGQYQIVKVLAAIFALKVGFACECTENPATGFVVFICDGIALGEMNLRVEDGLAIGGMGQLDKLMKLK